MIVYGLLLVCVAGVSATEIHVENKTVDVGCSVTINVTCVPSEPVKGWEFKVRYDHRILSVTSLFKGDFFDGYDQFYRGTINDTDGVLWNVYNLIVGQGNVSGAGILVVIDFIAIGIGNSSIELFGLGVCNETKYIDCSFTNGSVTVNGSPNQENETVIQPEENRSSDYVEKKPSFDSPIGTFATSIVVLFIVYCFIAMLSKR